MKMPGRAPSTPASHDPSVLTTAPSSYSFESSTRYQTLPALSWANQSYVSSTTSPSTDATSWTTIVDTPITVRRSSSTSTTTPVTSPSLLRSS